MKDTNSKNRTHEGWLDILWALVMLQGAMLALMAVEILVMNLATGFLLVANLALTVGVGAIAFSCARGLRRRKLWARRITMTAQWFIIALATLDLGLTVALANTAPDLVPLITGFVIPAGVLTFLRKTKQDFKPRKVEPENHTLAVDDPVLGTLVA